MGDLFYKAAGTATVNDLLSALEADQGVSHAEKAQLIQNIQMTIGQVPGNTPLSSLMNRGLGGMLGMLISRYFGMGLLGQAVSAVSGFGLASSLLGHSKPPNPHPGWVEM